MSVIAGPTKIVVFGRSGQVARSLANLQTKCEMRFFGRADVDPTNPETVEAIIARQSPRLVLNAAAYTMVDLAEKEQGQAFALNAELPVAIAVACSKRDIPFVHVSSDYVFDGTKVGAYSETDAANPLSVYGASKLAGDQGIARTATCPYAILRASWVFSHVGETFPRKILRRAFSVKSLRVVDDQVGCPTPSDDLASVMLDMGSRLLDGDKGAIGLFNYCGDTAMSWFDFAARLVEIAGPLGLGDCEIAKMKTEELNLPAKRPANSVLDCDLILKKCSIQRAGVLAAIDRAAKVLASELASGA